MRTRLAVFTYRQCERDNGRLSVNSLAVIQIIRQASVLLSKEWLVNQNPSCADEQKHLLVVTTGRPRTSSVECWSGRIFDQPKIQDKIRFNQIYFPKGFLYGTGNNNIWIYVILSPCWVILTCISSRPSEIVNKDFIWDYQKSQDSSFRESVFRISTFF